MLPCQRDESKYDPNVKFMLEGAVNNFIHEVITMKYLLSVENTLSNFTNLNSYFNFSDRRQERLEGLLQIKGLTSKLRLAEFTSHMEHFNPIRKSREKKNEGGIKMCNPAIRRKSLSGKDIQLNG